MAAAAAPVGPRPGEHRFAADDSLSDRHEDLVPRRQEDVHPRSELHEADPLAALHDLAFVDAADDAPGENADDLAEDDRPAVAVDPDLVELVVVRLSCTPAETSRAGSRCV